jgi:phosphomethylpyrimidine synthase
VARNKISKPSYSTGSRVYGISHPGKLKVPFKEIELTTGEKIHLYDTSGPYLDSDPKKIPAVRDKWISKRKGARLTQMAYAKKGIITEEMEFAALREEVASEFVRKEVASGRAIIPANMNHKETEPMIIGRKFLVKINANIGSSSLVLDEKMELEKMKTAIRAGADTVMDLSTGGNLRKIRESILRASPVPVGTVPIYEAFERAKRNVQKLSWEIYKEVLMEQAEQGVDYFTIHAGVLRSHLPKALKRKAGIVSRGGSIMASWMCAHEKENFLYTRFDEILDILASFDSAISIGDGLRPGCIADANDAAQFAELKTLGELTKLAWERDVQVMIEGPGHVPVNLIEENVRLQKKLCHDAPFYTLGPLVTDIGAGRDHITSAIGGALIASLGAAMICYVTPREHLGLPTLRDVEEGIYSHKIAAHAGDLAKGNKMALKWDAAMAEARASLRWNDQFALSLEPEYSFRTFVESGGVADESEPYCTMCGPDYCAMKISKKLKEDSGRKK